MIAQTPDAKQKRSKNTKITLTVIVEEAPNPDPSESSEPPDDNDPGGNGGTDGQGTVDGLLSR